MLTKPTAPCLPFICAVCGQLTATAQQHEATLDRLQRLSERLALTQQEKVRCCGGWADACGAALK